MLIVEDAEDSRELFALVFETAGFRTVCAESVGEALKVMCNASIDAVVTDYQLPDGDGLSLLDAATKQGLLHRGVPVVLCTAYTGLRAAESHAVAVLTKPVDTAKLVRVVHEAIATRTDQPESEMAS